VRLTASPCLCPASQEEQKGTIDGELATVLASVSLACKQIASLVNRAGISNLTGVAGNQNVQVGT
jgi:fructose-1,6-bisphosphatase I